MRQNHLRIGATRRMCQCSASDVENERPHATGPLLEEGFRQHARSDSDPRRPNPCTRAPEKHELPSGNSTAPGGRPRFCDRRLSPARVGHRHMPVRRV
jgi:hypothetical protein